MKIKNKRPAAERAKDDEKRYLRSNQLLNATPQQIDNYIESHVTDLDSAKEVLKLIAKIAILKP